MILVQKLQLGKLFEILHEAAVIFTGLTRNNPSDMRPPDAPRYRGMHIFAGIRVAMVHAMMRRPPENAHLRAGLGEKGEEQTEELD